MAWQTVVSSSQGNFGSYGLLELNFKQANTGWDSSDIVIAQPLDVIGLTSCYFSQGAPHPIFAGLYCSGVEFSGYWHANLALYNVSFLGLIGGANGMTTRQEIEGSQRRERNITATEFFKPGDPGYGTEERPLFQVPGGYADTLRFIDLQPYSEKEFITNIQPPTTYSLDALKQGAKVLTLAPAARLDAATGINRVASFPNGMLASAVQFTHHPAASVSMWILSIRWECVPAFSNA